MPMTAHTSSWPRWTRRRGCGVTRTSNSSWSHPQDIRRSGMLLAIIGRAVSTADVLRMCKRPRCQFEVATVQSARSRRWYVVVGRSAVCWRTKAGRQP